MVLREWIEKASPQTLVYIGCDSKNYTARKTNGSGFVYIGYAETAPVDEYGDRYIQRVYPHDTDYPGTTVIIDGIEHGEYWTWHECDPDVPSRIDLYTENDAPFEDLIMAVAKVAVIDYKRMISTKVKCDKPTHLMEVDDIIGFCRRKADLDFLKGSNIGEYLIRAVEDEVRIEWMYPKVHKMPYEKRYDFMKKKRRELMQERIKEQEKSIYATIKGRSVRRDMD